MQQSRQIIVQNLEIRERVMGAGPPLLMAHGWGAHIGLLMPLAERLARGGCRVYMLDLPGFGGSATPSQPFTIFDYARFCIAYLDHHGLAKVDFFGHSLGGRIGLALASDHADRVRAMVLSNSAGLRAAQPLSQSLRLRLYRSVRGSLARLGAKDLAKQLSAYYSRRYGSADYQAASPVMRATLVNIVNQDLLAWARRVGVPTLLIWGDQDQETPLWMGKKLEAAIPDAALIVHAGAGHYAYLDAPDKTAAIMLALFQRSHRAD